jgi:hypothetical protein
VTIAELWDKIRLRFDPQRPVPWEEIRHDPRPGAADKWDWSGWIAQRTYDPLVKIQHKLSLRTGPPRRILYLGTVGTGKTTELRRLAKRLSEGDSVLFIDLIDHFDRVVQDVARLQDISAWEVCFLVGLMLVERAAALSPPGEDLLRDLQDAWRAAAAETDTHPPRSELDMIQLARAALSGAGFFLGPLGTAATKVADAALSKVRWTLPIGAARRPLPRESQAGLGLLACVNRIINRIQDADRRVVVIIDGLDRLGLDRFGPGRKESLSRIHQVFIETDLLSRLACPVVICGPFLLRHHPSALRVRDFEPFVHANEPVLRKDDPAQPGEGVAFFHELYRLRVRDLGPTAERLIPHEQIQRLAYHGGGRSRDFVRLVSLTAEEALVRDGGPPAQADGALIDGVLRQARLDMELGIDAGHLQLLRKVMQDPAHDLPPHDEKVEELLTTGWLLPYPNEHEWFYPHPLLLMVRLR